MGPVYGTSSWPRAGWLIPISASNSSSPLAFLFFFLRLHHRMKKMAAAMSRREPTTTGTTIATIVLAGRPPLLLLGAALVALAGRAGMPVVVAVCSVADDDCVDVAVDVDSAVDVVDIDVGTSEVPDINNNAAAGVGDWWGLIPDEYSEVPGFGFPALFNQLSDGCVKVSAESVFGCPGVSAGSPEGSWKAGVSGFTTDDRLSTARRGRNRLILLYRTRDMVSEIIRRKRYDQEKG